MTRRSAIEHDGVDVVVVAYNCEASVRRCVAEALRLGGLSVTVVDNGSTDSTLDEITGFVDGRFRLIRCDNNPGYAAACNEGARDGLAAAILFLNADCIPDLGGTRRLISHLNAKPHVALVAPALIDPQSRLQDSVRKFPTVARLLTGRSGRVDPALRGHGAISVDQPAGAALLVRREIFETLGGFDPRFPLYYEDVDLCLRIRQAGFDIETLPSATFIHLGGLSQASAITEAFIRARYSRALYARLHHGRLVAAAAVAATCAECGLRFSLRAIGSHRGKRASPPATAWRAYIRAIRSAVMGARGKRYRIPSD